ncbi:hypothetical protein QSV34_10610 [Porticoccus sp. W117]|uniref:hypothetical protein n=1 Tax=Porticoccus sp. W117 TaxID=3054777 RepID=UPI002595D654|nr:hypothetical protein [Porticoccus sp. W117]MDM3871802.1 hypothetical protein [Porticoccus sp. W117]
MDLAKQAKKIMEDREEMTLSVFIGDDDCFIKSSILLLDALITNYMTKHKVSDKEALSHILDAAIYEEAVNELGLECVDRIVRDFAQGSDLPKEWDSIKTLTPK